MKIIEKFLNMRTYDCKVVHNQTIQLTETFYLVLKFGIQQNNDVQQATLYLN